MNLTNVTSAVSRWRNYRRTVEALKSLDQRELNDLGIGQWQIEDVARKAAR